MTFLPIDTYLEYVRVKKVTQSKYAKYKKCLYCRRQMNKGDYFIGNSRRWQHICRKCAEQVLKNAQIECDKLKGVFAEAVKDLEENKEQYDNDELLNNL